MRTLHKLICSNVCLTGDGDLVIESSGPLLFGLRDTALIMSDGMTLDCLNGNGSVDYNWYFWSFVDRTLKLLSKKTKERKLSPAVNTSLSVDNDTGLYFCGQATEGDTVTAYKISQPIYVVKLRKFCQPCHKTFYITLFRWVLKLPNLATSQLQLIEPPVTGMTRTKITLPIPLPYWVRSLP